MSVPPAALIVSAILVYLAILLLLRISGKRQVGQMSAPELIAIMLISNAVQNSMNGGDNSLVGGLLSASVLLALTWLISTLTYHVKAFRHVFEGTPTLLIHDGKPIDKNLSKERLRLSEVRVLLRHQGVDNFNEVHTAILEPDGSLSVTRHVDLIQAPKE